MGSQLQASKVRTIILSLLLLGVYLWFKLKVGVLISVVLQIQLCFFCNVKIWRAECLDYIYHVRLAHLPKVIFTTTMFFIVSCSDKNLQQERFIVSGTMSRNLIPMGWYVDPSRCQHHDVTACLLRFKHLNHQQQSGLDFKTHYPLFSLFNNHKYFISHRCCLEWVWKQK